MQTCPGHRPARFPRHARGFTLVEAALVTIIIGVGILAILQLLAAGTVANADAAEVTAAVTLANDMRELSLGLPLYDPQQNPALAPRVWNSREATLPDYDNVTDLDGPTDTWDTPGDPDAGYQRFKPPVDGTRRAIAGFPNWTQCVKVETVVPSNLRTLQAHNPDAEAARVTVKILRDEVEVYRTSWFVCPPLAANP